MTHRDSEGNEVKIGSQVYFSDELPNARDYLEQRDKLFLGTLTGRTDTGYRVDTHDGIQFEWLCVIRADLMTMDEIEKLPLEQQNRILKSLARRYVTQSKGEN